MNSWILVALLVALCLCAESQCLQINLDLSALTNHFKDTPKTLGGGLIEMAAIIVVGSFLKNVLALGFSTMFMLSILIGSSLSSQLGSRIMMFGILTVIWQLCMHSDNPYHTFTEYVRFHAKRLQQQQ